MNIHRPDMRLKYYRVYANYIRKMLFNCARRQGVYVTLDQDVSYGGDPPDTSTIDARQALLVRTEHERMRPMLELLRTEYNALKRGSKWFVNINSKFKGNKVKSTTTTRGVFDE